MRLGSRVFLVLLFLTSPLFGSEWRELFEDYFHHNYQARYCGLNAEGFLKKIEENGGDLRRFYLVAIENKGGSCFGLLNAEKTRGWRRNRPSVEEANWYHHFFVLDDEGNVYDFDFTIEPTILPVEEYLEEMFLREEKTENGGRFYVGRQKKLADYYLTSLPANQVFQGKNHKDGKSFSLEQVMKNWKKLTRPERRVACHKLITRF